MIEEIEDLEGMEPYPKGYSDIREQKGTFKEGVLSGKGQILFWDGRVYEGTFANGVLVEGTKDYSAAKDSKLEYEKGKFVDDKLDAQGETGVKSIVKSVINDIFDKVKEIEEKKNELKTNSSLTNIFSMRKKLKEKRVVWLDLLSKKKAIEDQISIGEYWDAAFDFRNEGSIKSYIINKIIPVFNSILSNFISIMFDGQMTISFDGSFEESIVYGGEIFDYNQLSTGEKGKLNLCIAFTIFNITRMNLVSINCMFLDEVFAGMDPSTIKKFIDIIRKSYSKQLAVFVVGYEAGVDEFLNPDSILTVKKENGESFID